MEHQIEHDANKIKMERLLLYKKVTEYGVGVCGEVLEESSTRKNHENL